MLTDIFVEGNIIYIVFLGLAIIAFHLKKVWLRYPIMLLALAMIGFLQMGCPSPVRSLQFIFASLGNLSAVIAFEVKLLIVLLSAAVYGKIFCGWVCPKGTIQEFLYQRKLRITVPPRLDRMLRKLKYVLLLLVMLLPAIFHYALFTSDTAPFAALFNLGGGTLAVVFLGIILAASLFIYRPFCRYICPTGALLGMVSYLNRVKFSSKGCTLCGMASKTCDIGALRFPGKDQDASFSVDKGECIMCGECRTNCPKGITIHLFSTKKEGTA